MSQRDRLQLLLHGSIVILLAALCGIPYSLAIPGAWGEEAVRAWRLTHIGPAVAGIWLLAAAGAAHLLNLSASAAAVCVWSLVASAYSFAIAAVLAASFGVRGLELTGPIANLVVFTGYAVGAAGSVVGLGVMLFGVCASLRSVPDNRS